METTEIAEITETIPNEYYDLYSNQLNSIHQSNLDMIELQEKEIEHLANINEGIAVANQLLIYLLMLAIVFGLCGMVKAFTKWFGMFLH